MATRKLKIACAGLGRMGARHAMNLLTRTPRAELVAVFSPEPKEIDWARRELEPSGVKIYTNYDEMLSHPSLEAVLIATVTTAHAEEAIKAIEADKHVLCEKPLSTSVDVVSVLRLPLFLQLHLNVDAMQEPKLLFTGVSCTYQVG
jgi:myo-inositol 2-dehydrogenase/D-chiro-inositol 1-dehydrogenase